MKVPENQVGERVSEVLSVLKKNRKIEGNKDLLGPAGFSSVSSITEIVKGRQEPPIDFLNMLYERYNINIDYIISGKAPMIIEKGNDFPETDTTLNMNPENEHIHSKTFAEMVAANRIHAEARLLEAKNNNTILELIKANSSVKEETLLAVASTKRQIQELLIKRDLQDGKYSSVEEATSALSKLIHEIDQTV